MSEPPELESLVRRYLDLWQEQWAAMAADPELADAFARWFATLSQAGGAMFAGLMPGFNQFAPRDFPPAAGERHGRSSEERSEAPGQPGRTQAARAASARASSGRGNLDVAELARRLAALDERLAAVEAGTPAGRNRTSKKPRRRRT